MRLLKIWARKGNRVEEQGMTCPADIDPDHPLTPLAGGVVHVSHRTGARDGLRVLCADTRFRTACHGAHRLRLTWME
jgi:hypothetical protein